MLEDIRFPTDDTSSKIQKYLPTLKYNNIDSVIKHKSNIKLVEMTDVHHGNILDREEKLVAYITKFQLTERNRSSAEEPTKVAAF